MLTAEQVKPFIQHEDLYVRRAAVEYFHDSWSQDTELAALILEACRRYGYDSWLMGTCVRLPWTEAAFDGFLADLPQITDEFAASALVRWMAKAPLELLKSRDLAPLQHERYLGDWSALFKNRQWFAAWSAERLWEELQAFAQRCEKKYTSEIDNSYVNALIEKLADGDIPDAQTIVQLLAAYDEEKGDWLEMFLIELAGARRLREAVPELVRRFHFDGDLMLEECKEALGRIGDVEAVRLILAEYPSASWEFRNYAIGCLGTIKHPEAEEANLALLPDEDEPAFRAWLGQNLCELFSERGVEAVLRLIKDKSYDRFFVHLEDELLPVLDVFGIELPESAVWRKEREEKVKKAAEREAALFAAMEAGTSAPKKPKPKLKLKRNITTPTAPAKESAGWGKQTSIPKTQRVGRNDPCPCGSGKKFKKCCGRNT